MRKRHQTPPPRSLKRSESHISSKAPHPSRYLVLDTREREIFEVATLVVEQRRNHPSAHILDNRMSRLLDKPPKLSGYEETRDTDEYIEHVDNIVDYYQVEGPAKG